VRVVFVGRNRVIWRRLVLYVLTLGISRRVWLYRINKELDGHEALGLNHPLNAVLLCLPVLGPTVVTLQTAVRTRAMLAGSGIPYGPAAGVWALTLVPILGNLFFISWEQSRLNRFWSQERGSADHGVEIDIDLSEDPDFVVELGRAVRESYFAGSRFDRRKNARKARWQARAVGLRGIRAERAAVRAVGGTTPVLPWMRPRRPAPRALHVTCGRCDTRFDVARDPTAQTPLVCPKCGLAEILPSLAADPLAGRDAATVATVQVRCPQCSTRFQAARNLARLTPLRCPGCGREDVLPPPDAGAASPGAPDAPPRPTRPARRKAKASA
jgi:DNA-directed RNA polymerase subunit RPC12/RpoP